MNTASFRFYGPLNDFLPKARRQVRFNHAFNADQSIKHLLEALGVPHTEVDLILVNGVSVDFSYLPRQNDRISVYPRFKTIDISSLTRVRPQPPQNVAFVVDNHLGRLAAYLRMLGFDTLYQNDYQDGELTRLANQQERILLTRDRGLLKRKAIAHGYWVREKDPRRQLVEVMRRFDLFNKLAPFTRCLRCNGRLQPIPKQAILDRLQPKTIRYYHQFAICKACDQIYWQGSHWERMQRFIASLREEGEPSPQKAAPNMP